jgi:hypothetical protein
MRERSVVQIVLPRARETLPLARESKDQEALVLELFPRPAFALLSLSLSLSESLLSLPPNPPYFLYPIPPPTLSQV